MQPSRYWSDIRSSYFMHEFHLPQGWYIRMRGTIRCKLMNSLKWYPFLPLYKAIISKLYSLLQLRQCWNIRSTTSTIILDMLNLFVYIVINICCERYYIKSSDLKAHGKQFQVVWLCEVDRVMCLWLGRVRLNKVWFDQYYVYMNHNIIR